MTMHATPVTSDDWAISLQASEERATMVAQAKIDQRKAIWSGVGWILGLAVVVAGVLGLCWFWYDSVNGTREGDIRIEHEKTEQIRACTALSEPLERQYCLMSINQPKDTTGG